MLTQALEKRPGERRPLHPALPDVRQPASRRGYPRRLATPRLPYPLFNPRVRKGGRIKDLLHHVHPGSGPGSRERRAGDL